MSINIANQHSEYKSLTDMEQLVLKQEIVDAIKKDPTLYANVARALRISPYTMPKVLGDNEVRLTQASVLKVIREHLNVKEDSELLTPELEAA